MVRLLTEHDIYHFREGTHFRAYEKLGAHLLAPDGQDARRHAGSHFAVWAPNAARVSVVGDFNAWNAQSHGLDAAQRLSGAEKRSVRVSLRGAAAHGVHRHQPRLRMG